MECQTGLSQQISLETGEKIPPKTSFSKLPIILLSILLIFLGAGGLFIGKYFYVSQSTPIPPPTPKSTITPPVTIVHNLVIAVEKQTAVKYPDIQSKIKTAIDQTNNLMASAGINRQWQIIAFRSDYDKNIATGCKAATTAANNLPEEFCNHPSDYIYAIFDEVITGRGSVSQLTSTEIHGYSSDLFDAESVCQIAHELAHSLALPDLYYNFILAENNFVNNEYNDHFRGDIMGFCSANAAFSKWEAELINHNSSTLPLQWNSYYKYRPQHNYLKILDRNHKPLINVQVRIFNSSFAPNGYGNQIDDVPEITATTNSHGQIFLGDDLSYDLMTYLIEIKTSSQTDYQWLDFTDINFAYWSGQTDTAIYNINTNIN